MSVGIPLIVASPGGSTGDVQYNNSGTFAGSGFTMVGAVGSEHLVGPGASDWGASINAESVWVQNGAGSVFFGDTNVYIQGQWPQLMAISAIGGVRVVGGGTTNCITLEQWGGVRSAMDQYGSWVWNRVDAATNTVSGGQTIGHTTSATPANGFGVNLVFELQSSTTAGREAGEIDAVWVNATDASRTARVVHYVSDATANREAMRIESSGTAPMIGFLGAAAAAQQTGGAATAGSTYGTNEQTMLQTVYNAMRTFGLLS
jgi:hypothetical protein